MSWNSTTDIDLEEVSKVFEFCASVIDNPPEEYRCVAFGGFQAERAPIWLQNDGLGAGSLLCRILSNTNVLWPINPLLAV